MASFIAPILTVGMFLAIYALLLPHRNRVTTFNPSRARTRARSASSGNGLLLLAAVNLATLVYELISQGAGLHEVLAAALSVLLPVFLLTAIVLLVVSRSLADLVIGLVGVSAALTGAFLQGGAPAVIAVLVLSMLTLVLLGWARGFLRPPP